MLPVTTKTLSCRWCIDLVPDLALEFYSKSHGSLANLLAQQNDDGSVELQITLANGITQHYGLAGPVTINTQRKET